MWCMQNSPRHSYLAVQAISHSPGRGICNDVSDATKPAKFYCEGPLKSYFAIFRLRLNRYVTEDTIGKLDVEVPILW